MKTTYFIVKAKMQLPYNAVPFIVLTQELERARITQARGGADRIQMLSSRY